MSERLEIIPTDAWRRGDSFADKVGEHDFGKWSFSTPSGRSRTPWFQGL
ncbi:MAG: DUF4279 domain-containing protein [Cyanobacteria bacterium REEB67]|nr:DUF4279 domain-containing protein [Cyanobacteria bacterium REEB67]